MTAFDDSTIFKQCSKKANCIHPEKQGDGWLPATLDYFHRNKQNLCGLTAACKACGCERNRQCYAAHREQNAERKRRYNAAHPEQIAERQRQYRAAHQDEYAEQKRQYYAAHQDEYAEHTRNRRARKRAAPGTHTTADIAAQLKRQKGRCYYAACGHCKLGKQYHVEHVIPLSREGSRNDMSNIVLSCLDCNLKKGSKLPHEWAQGGRLL